MRVVYAPESTHRLQQSDRIDRIEDAYRVVGFIEYGKALQRFDTLLKTIRPAELTAMDELVREDAHYHVFVKSAGSDEQQQSRGKRAGLQSVIALARIEYASIVAGFSRPNVPLPIPPLRAYDGQVFDEFLFESAIRHASGLAKSAKKQPPKAHLLPLYGRSLLAVKTAAAAQVRLANKLTVAQQTELRVAGQTANTIARALRKQILAQGVRTK